MASEIVVEDIVEEFGEYYVDNGQNAQRLSDQFFVASETAETLTRVPTKSTRIEGAMVNQDSVLQAFQPNWTPKGNVSFAPWINNLQAQKIDLTYSAADLAKVENSWLGFLATLDTPAREEWPLIRFLLEKYVLQKRNEEYELHAIHKGVYVAPTPGTAGAPGESMNGIGLKLAQGIAAGYIDPITGIGTIDPTKPVEFVTYMEDFVKAIPEELVGDLDSIRMSRALRTLFREGMRAKYNMNYNQASDLTTLIDHNIPIVGLASMAGTKTIWTARKGNSMEWTKRPLSANSFKIEADKRNVNIYTDWWKGVGFWDPRYVFTNDQDIPEIDEDDEGDET